MQRMVRGSIAAAAIMASFLAMRSPAGAEDTYRQQERSYHYEARTSSTNHNPASNASINRLAELNEKGEFMATLELASKALYDSNDKGEQLQLLGVMTEAFDGMWKRTSDTYYAKRAIDALVLQMRLDPNEPGTYLEIARWNAVMGDYPIAIAFTKKAMVLGAASVNELFTLAGYYELNRQYDEAIDAYSRLVKHDASMLTRRGQCRLKMGQHKEAGKDFKKAIRAFERWESKYASGDNLHQPEYPLSHYLLGQVHYLNGDYREAARHYWEARRLNADYFCFDDRRAPWYGDKHEPTEQEETEFRESHTREAVMPRTKKRDAEIEERQRRIERERKEKKERKGTEGEGEEAYTT